MFLTPASEAIRELNQLTTAQASFMLHKFKHSPQVAARWQGNKGVPLERLAVVFVFKKWS